MNKFLVFTKLLCAYLFTTVNVQAQQVVNFEIVPKPDIVELNATKGYFDFSKDFIISTNGDDNLIKPANFLKLYISDILGKGVTISDTNDKKQNKAKIILTINSSLLDEESFVIYVKKNSISIEGGSYSGVFYGIQTLRKALLTTDSDNVIIPIGKIKSSPKYRYRGLHLDVSRHYFDVNTIKEFIDMMALHGFNKFHWHITDDQGWRIKINKYPLLTKVGAYRNETVVGRNSGLYDNRHYGKYYTEEECREIVEYARDRGITVIPEIDMPGHMLAALTAYPHLGCRGKGYEVARSWGVFEDILCAGREETFEFVEDVLREVMDIFPSEYIHIGGDEAPKARWEECQDCQKRIAELGLKDDERSRKEEKLQGYFTRRVEKFLNDNGRRIIGWDEILDGGVDASATVMSWRGVDGGKRAAESGHDVIMVPMVPLYFDYYQTPATDWINPTLIGGLNTLEMVYGFDPVAPDMSEGGRSRIVGVQGNVWTEYIDCPDLLFYQSLPRVAALSEVAWTDRKVMDFGDFTRRVARLFPLYDLAGWKYCKRGVTE